MNSSNTNSRMDSDSSRDPEEPVLDPADYLFNNTKYHDRHFTVGDPASATTVEFGVVTSYLVSQSTVFRAMLQDSNLADFTGENTHITDITPEIFKLMLRFMYGGVMPQMSKDEFADLLLSADKYNIQSLVKWTSKRLIPSTVDDLFPALRCVVYVFLPDLAHHVSRILQNQTIKVVENQAFFQLDDKCMEFITKQEALAITEVELWKSLVSWVKKMTDDPAEQRRLITSPLKHVRFLTFTQDQIVRDVMSSNLLSPEEMVYLLSAVTNNQAVALQGLCPIKERRGIIRPLNEQCNYTTVDNNSKLTYNKKFDCEYFRLCPGVHQRKLIKCSEYAFKSNLTITCFDEQVFLESFMINTRSLIDQNNVSTYSLSCTIIVNSYDQNTSIKDTTTYSLQQRVVSGMGGFNLSLFKSELPLTLTPKRCYNFFITFSVPHPVFVVKDYVDSKLTDVTNDEMKGNHFSVKFNTPRHVKQINYDF